MPELVSAKVNRRAFLQFVGAMGTAAAFSGALAACGGPSSSRNGEGSGGSGTTTTIEAGLSYALSTGFDPMITSGATPFAANLHIFEALVDLDPVTREPYAALAAAMPELVDDTTLRVVLRESATFHDGSPVTADDVVFTFTRILDPANASLIAQFIPFVSGVTAVDDRTVDITLDHPFALATERLCVARIVPKAIVEADPAAFDASPVGSGPYALVSATKDDKIVFQKHADYNGPRPAKADDMIWRLLSDPAARITAFESGRVSAIEDVPYIDVERLTDVSELESVLSFGLLFLMFNCSVKPFDDKRVRQALFHAIDYEKLISTAFLGNAEAATSYVQQTHPLYLPAKNVYTYDPAKAKDLLAKAGLTKLSVTMVTTDTAWVVDAAPLIKESWDAIGVATTIDSAQSGGQYADKIDPGNFELMVAPGDPSVFGNDLDLLLRWWYDGIWPEQRFRWAGTPQHDQVLDLMNAAVQTSDEAAQRAAWQQVIDLISDEVPLYPIVHRKLPTAWNSEKAPQLEDFQPLPTTGLSFLDVSVA